ncbi:pyridoxal phosphate-dependent aminotransferase [Eubacteriales bacterium OttesenSCG-928-K08]|nr:pyridoxal phosphate-dependent aminotransferase [Eubacteriales bacterium OttesenSCG-928-K08]
MRIIEQADKLQKMHYEVRGPVVEEADKMLLRGENVLKLNIGNPAVFGFNAPDALFDEIAAHIRDAQPYSDSKGILSSREAIVEYCTSKGFPNVDSDSVFIGNGASDVICIAMQALLNTGDEILLPSPDYPLWTAAVNLSGGTPVHYICDEQADWNPDIESIKKSITPRTKAIVVINPNNPTGALYSLEVLKEIVEIARQNDLIIFADEIYDRVVMEGEHTSIASLAPDLFCVTFNGLSKSHIICGYRCGWMALSGDKSRAQGYIAGINMLASIRLCANVPAQYVIPVALKDKENPHCKPGGRLYEQGKYVYEALNRIPGVSAVKPKAAMYIFPKLDKKVFNITDDQKFALDFLHQQRVLVVQGTGFNWIKPDHFRIVFLPEVAQLKNAMEKLENFLSNYRQ